MQYRMFLRVRGEWIATCQCMRYIQITGRRSPVSLYSEAMSSFEDAGAEDTYDQRDAAGFIRLQGLRLSR